MFQLPTRYHHVIHLRPALFFLQCPWHFAAAATSPGVSTAPFGSAEVCGDSRTCSETNPSNGIKPNLNPTKKQQRYPTITLKQIVIYMVFLSFWVVFWVVLLKKRNLHTVQRTCGTICLAVANPVRTMENHPTKCWFFNGKIHYFNG